MPDKNKSFPVGYGRGRNIAVAAAYFYLGKICFASAVIYGFYTRTASESVIADLFKTFPERYFRYSVAARKRLFPYS